MTIISIIVPLAAFGSVIGWMLYSARHDKAEYFRRKAEDACNAQQIAREDKLVEALRRPDAPQSGQVIGFAAAALGGSESERANQAAASSSSRLHA